MIAAVYARKSTDQSGVVGCSSVSTNVEVSNALRPSTSGSWGTDLAGAQLYGRHGLEQCRALTPQSRRFVRVPFQFEQRLWRLALERGGNPETPGWPVRRERGLRPREGRHARFLQPGPS